MSISKNIMQYHKGRFGQSELFAIPMDKFKTCSVAVFISDDLSRESVTLNSLIPAVLRRGTNNMPDYMHISAKLERLFGCAFDCGVTKKGDIQVMYFYTEMISEEFLPGKRRIFDDAAETLMEVISDPLVQNGCFNDEYVRIEKENLSRIIDSRINDKIQYSVERCFESMYAGEPYSLYEYGLKDDINAIGSKDLFEHYERIVCGKQKTVFITGRFGEYELNRLKSLLAGETYHIGHFGKLQANMAPGRASAGDISVETDDDAKHGQSLKIVRENMDIGQTKYCIGFKTGILPDNRLYYPLVVCSSIFGGGIHSKLFRNVREKEGLAYYVFSRLEKFKGAIVASGGIGEGTAPKVQELILAQIGDLKEGKITSDEIDAAVKTIETGIKGIKDNQLQVADYYYGQYLYGMDDSLDTAIGAVKNVKLVDVVEAASAINADTVYILSGFADNDAIGTDILKTGDKI